MARERYRRAVSGDKKDEVLAKQREYQRNYWAKKKVIFNVNHDDQEAFDSSLWEPEDALHGIEGMKSLNYVIADERIHCMQNE
jgi:hypothetical protein